MGGTWMIHLLVALAIPSFARAEYPACPDGLICIALSPADKPGLTFDCAYVKPNNERGQVYHMHGNDGLLSKAMFAETMLQLAAKGFTSLACDQRGYSPKASPDQYAAYLYDTLVGDIFSIVDSFGFGLKFHVVSHDQGARVAWHAIALGRGRQRFLSLASLSIPHADVFSDSLVGPNCDHDQQTASQYVRLLVLPNSTTIYDDTIFTRLCKSLGFTNPAACQKVLWWYNGAIDAGSMALAPLMPFGPVAKSLGVPEDAVKNLTQYPIAGVAQTVRVGRVTELPVLYACGALDSADLCKQAFADESRALIANFSYTRLGACGHDILASECIERQAVIDGVLSNVLSVYQHDSREVAPEGNAGQ